MCLGTVGSLKQLLIFKNHQTILTGPTFLKLTKGARRLSPPALLQMNISVMFGLGSVQHTSPLKDLMNLMEKSRDLVLRSVSF